MIISNLKKVKNTKKIVKFTLGLGGLLFSASLIYFFFLKGYNQSFILGTTGICLVAHAGYVLSKKLVITPAYMAQSYLISAVFLFISWATLSFLNSVISGVYLFSALSFICFLAAFCIKKYERNDNEKI